MSIALSEFWTRLVRAGIADTEACRAMAAAYAESHGGSPPEDAVALAKFLVRSRRVTEYQARALLASTPVPLRFGDFLRVGDHGPPPLSGWMPVRRLVDGANGYLHPVPATPELSAASAAAIETAAAIEAPSLQPLQWTAEAERGGGRIFSLLPPGRLLSELPADQRRIAPARVAALGTALAEALGALHRAGITHGQVRADRVWLVSGGEPVLLRDPWCLLAADGEPTEHGLLEDLAPDAPYVAPERSGAGQAPDASSDLYGLGGLLFYLRFGRHAFDGRSAEEIAAGHRDHAPEELVAAVERGPAGDPLLRVIAFALAKNRGARFADAAQLAGALRAAGQGIGADAGGDSPDRSPSTEPAAATSQPAGKETAAAGAATGPASTTPVSTAPVSEPVEDAPHPNPRPRKAGGAGTLGPAATAVRRRRKKKSRAPLVLGALCIPVLMLIILLIVGPGESEPERPTPPSTVSRAPGTVPSVTGGRSTAAESRPASAEAARDRAPERSSASEQASPGGYELVRDDRLLWAPPYGAGEPAPTELLPPGPGVILTVRLSRWRDSPAGQTMLEPLSPELTDLLDAAAERAGVPLESIDRLSVALHPGDRGQPDVSLAVELAEAMPLEDLIERWRVAESRTPEGETVYAGDEVDADAYYVAAEDGSAGGSRSVSRFAVGPVERIGEVASVRGGPIPLPVALQRLWDRSSDRADLVVLATPNFVLADARGLLEAAAPKLRRPLRRLLIPDAAGVLISAAADQSRLYSELRLASSGTSSDGNLLRRVREAVQGWPEWASEFLVDSDPDPSWRPLAARLPLMLQFLVDHTRLGLADGHVVANAYLPAPAASQTALATLLAWNTPAAPAAAPAAGTAPAALSLDQMLEREMSISFGQESLESAVRSVAEEFNGSLPDGSELPPVRLVGGDLEKMGITQNQQIRDFSQSDQPLRRVLTRLVVSANPDQSASGPADPKQALVWVVADDPQSPDQKTILITTRQAAEDRYELPEEFRTGE